MKIRETIRSFASNIQTWSKTKIAAVIGMILAGTYVLLFVVPWPVTFTYAGETCVSRITLFPDIQNTIDTHLFAVNYSGGFSVAGTRLMTTKLCITPQTAPSEGSHTVATAPWGSWIFRSHYNIQVGRTPSIVAARTTAPLAITKPMTYAIDTVDKVFDYELSVGDKTNDCSVDSTVVSCGMQELALAQGAEHTVTLTRSFKDEKPTKLLTSTVSILPAVSVVSSSLQANQVIYDKPTGFSFVVDKPLQSAEVVLNEIDGETQTPINTTTTLDGATITVQLATELPREKTFVVTLRSVEAEDGSTIAEPYAVAFTTSGGPKVRSVSVGTAGVDPNARIVVTLDQTIGDGVDITKFARITGAAASVSRQGNQVIFALQNATRCNAITLTLEKGITSASNGLTSKDVWSYTSRINCKATVTIGYSVKGRPIVAYYYGSGVTTILFTGGMHGSEPSGTTTMQAWAAHLDTYAYKIPAGKQVVIIPNTNPDGIASGSRYNANNVNLARNFATADWKADIETSSGTIVGGGGSAPLSEPEAQALASITGQLNPRVEVSFHAQGRLVGANDYADSQAIGNVYAGLVGYSTMFGSSAEDIMGYGFSGQYEDWIGEKLGKPAILVELPSHSGNYFSSQQTALWRMVNL